MHRAHDYTLGLRLEEKRGLFLGGPERPKALGVGKIPAYGFKRWSARPNLGSTSASLQSFPTKHWVSEPHHIIAAAIAE